MSGTIELQRDGALAFLTLSHAGRLNAMSRHMWRDLREAALGLQRDPALRCVVVRGAGGAFCAGGDISEYPDFRFERERLRAFHEDEVWGALAALLAIEAPLVAQIEGACLGAGLEIASCCDIRLAGASAKFGAPIAKLGFPMAPREAALVAAAVGDTLARDMLLAAGMHGAARLLAAGFLLDVRPDAEVADAALAHAARVAVLAPQAARLNKRTLAALRAAELAPALLAAAYDYAEAHEHREGISAFLAKRAPVF